LTATVNSFLKNLPAFWMRSSSGGFDGLWSSVTRAGSALQLKTPRESPQLEKMTYLGLINTEHTVVPDLSSPLATSGIFLENEKKNHVKYRPKSNGILFSKLFRPTVRKKLF
jgi:hypothetical protein